jgi:hypothetical protein
MKSSWLLSCLFVAACAASAGADVVALDLSAGFNYDGYISDAEDAHAYTYTPPADWGLGSRMVNAVFGEHTPGTSNGRTYAWQSQVPQGGVGLPNNGQITTAYGTFQLSTDLDAEPVGGFVQIAKPTTPTGLLPLQANIIRAYRPHSGNTNNPLASISVDLPANQQARYDSINFLVCGSEGKVLIYADYADGQALIYESPGTPKTSSETGFPDVLAASTANPDLVEVTGYRMTYYYGQSGNYSDVRSGTARIWTFDEPLELDSSRTLVGFTLAIYNADTWKSRTAVVLAALADTANIAPTAAAGSDLAVDDSGGNSVEVVTLDGSASTDSDGTIVSYVWKEGATQIATGATATASLAVGTHTITLVVTDSDGATDDDTLLVTVSADVTWHVDAVNGSDATGNGTTESPYQTIGAVWSLLEGGQTVLLHDGDYGVLNKYTTYTPTPADLFEDWVTFKAAPGASPVLEHLWIGTGTSNTLDYSQGRQGNYDAYLRFEGLTIEDGVIIQNARYWALVDCLIERYGPWTGSVDNIEKTAVVIKAGDHITIEGCEITNTGTGLAGYGRDISLIGNWIHGGKHDGVRVTGFWNSLVEGNLIHDFDDGVTDAEEPTWSRHCDLIHIFIPGPGYAGWQNHNVVFRNNILYDTEAQGVQFNNYYATAATVRNELITFENNVFGPTHANMFNNADRCDGLIFRNNTVCKLAAARTYNRWSLANTTLRIGPSTDVEVYNNILGSVGFDAGGDVHLFDWNLIQTPGTPVGVDDQRAYGRFTLIGGAADLVDADAFDGVLSDTSDAINAGTDLFAPSALWPYDYEGTSRDNRPDLGAWEYPGLTPSAETEPPVYNDTKTCFLDDFEDGHYNDVDPWLQAENTQGMSWYRPAGYDTFKFYVTNSDTVLDRNALAGSSSASRNSWLLSEQGDDWVDYTFEFDAHNSYLTIGSGPLVLAQDPQNCYWLDISRDNGRLIRIMNGTSTTLATDADIEMPHSGEQHYKITVNVEAGGITISVDVGANGTTEMTFTDTDATALSTFTAGGVGFHEDTASANLKIRFDNIEVNVTDFDD